VTSGPPKGVQASTGSARARILASPSRGSCSATTSPQKEASTVPAPDPVPPAGPAAASRAVAGVATTTANEGSSVALARGGSSAALRRLRVLPSGPVPGPRVARAFAMTPP
jgi:hypothetical protein